eukprot:590674-Prymnesium_polylepis.1
MSLSAGHAVADRAALLAASGFRPDMLMPGGVRAAVDPKRPSRTNEGDDDDDGAADGAPNLEQANLDHVVLSRPRRSSNRRASRGSAAPQKPAADARGAAAAAPAIANDGGETQGPPLADDGQAAQSRGEDAEGLSETAAVR